MSDPRPWIQLSKAGVSAQALNRLLDEFGAPEAVLAQPASVIAAVARVRTATATRLLDPELARCDADLRLLDQLGIHLVTRADADFPETLRTIYDPPALLYLRGSLLQDDRAAIAVVGSRRATPYGREQARRLGRELAAAGFTVISGLARGVDTEAHRGALQGGGRTLAVLGCGADSVYPPENRKLADEIAANGALISEFPLGTPPDGWRFPIRNRIISGLALGVVVIDAPAGSGALLSAESAVDQNREVFAVPGPADHPNSAGAHQLIREGATLVTSVEEIIEELSFAPRRLFPSDARAASVAEPLADLSADELRLAELLGGEARPLDDLILDSGMAAGQVTGALVTLELKGVAQRHPGNYYSRA